MRLVGAMVGNSSSGLIEAACAPLPVVNVGGRQSGRERAVNVLDVAPEREAIRRGIATALSAAFRDSLGRLTNPYGDGHACAGVVEAIATMPPRERLLRNDSWIFRRRKKRPAK